MSSNRSPQKRWKPYKARPRHVIAGERVLRFLENIKTKFGFTDLQICEQVGLGHDFVGKLRMCPQRDIRVQTVDKIKKWAKAL